MIYGKADEHPGDARGTLLAIALSAAVPLHIMMLQEQGGPLKEQLASCEEIAHHLGEKGDVLLFGGGKIGEAADVFNAVAQGLAMLAFCPGRVTLFGEHWEAGEEC